MKVNEIVQAKRKEHKITYMKLADLMDCSTTLVANKLSGRIAFTVADIQKLCEIFKCKPNDLIPHKEVTT